MANDGWIEDPVLRQRYRFRRFSDERGEALEIDTWVEPGGGVTPHIHPAMEERFRVLAGEMTFTSGRARVKAGPGEEVLVPAGRRHAYRNLGSEPVHVVCEAWPPSTLEDFLTEAAGLSRAGKITGRGFPRGIGAGLDAAAFAHRHREMTVLLFPPLPPPWLQRIVLAPLARLGERRRVRARAAA